MKPDIEAIRDELAQAKAAYETMYAVKEKICGRAARLEAVVEVVRKRDKKIKERRKVVTTVDYLNEGYEKQITEVNQEINRFDRELEQSLQKLDGDGK